MTEAIGSFEKFVSPTGLYGVITKNTRISIFTALKTSNQRVSTYLVQRIVHFPHPFRTYHDKMGVCALKNEEAIQISINGAL
jgi:hypothetical protein